MSITLTGKNVPRNIRRLNLKSRLILVASYVPLSVAIVFIGQAFRQGELPPIYTIIIVACLIGFIIGEVLYNRARDKYGDAVHAFLLKEVFRRAINQEE